MKHTYNKMLKIQTLPNVLIITIIKAILVTKVTTF